VTRLAALQRQILDSALATLAPGGWLTYAVCSGEPEEGPDQLHRLLADRRDIAPDMPPRPGWARDAADLCTSDGALSTWPHRHGTDGFYAFRVRRR
jgi:16S rRNA (cytosine967-C5)-methyltransferase